MTTIFEGKTFSGRTLRLELHDDPLDVDIWIDGEEAHKDPSAFGAELFRDGGSRSFETDRGRVFLPHRIGNDDHRPRLDGEVVEGR